MNLLLAVPDGVKALGPAQPDAPTLAVIPGDDVALHRVHLIETGARARMVEARMRATDLAAQPIEELHIALGAPEADGGCWLALIDRERMATHLAHFQAAGADPAHMIPAPLLLDAPDDNRVDGVASAVLGALVLLRGHDFAAAVEPALAAGLAGENGAAAEFRPPRPAPLALDLRQGDFAPPVRWWTLPWFRWTAAILLVLMLALAVAPTIIGHQRAAAAIATHDAMTLSLAERALGSRPVNAATAADLLQQARLTADSSAVGARLALVATTLADIPAARLGAAVLETDGTLALTLDGPAEAIEAATAALRANQAFDLETNGANVRIGQRAGLPPTTDDPLASAERRLVAARSDAAVVLAHHRAAPPANGATSAAALLQQGLKMAGLPDVAVTTTNEAATAAMAAVRSPVLLPMLADIEARGGRLLELSITPNRDSTVATAMVITK